MLKRLSAILLAAILLMTGSAFASEAPTVPQEAKSPAQMLLEGIAGLWANDGDPGATEPDDGEPAEAEPEAAPETEAAHPGVEIASISGASNQRLKITYKNNLDVGIKDLTFILMTLNEDGTIATRAQTLSLRESYKDAHNWPWTMDTPLEPGQSCSDSYIYENNSYADNYYISLNNFPVIAAGVISYTTQDGVVYRYASDQVRFVTTEGSFIEPTAASLEPYTLPEEVRARAAEMSLGLICWEMPAYAADFYESPAGLYVDRALGGRVANVLDLRRGDIIISFGDVSALNPYATEYCEIALLDGEDVTVTYWRDGEILTTVFSLN